jgi:hypothetical protein
MKNYYLLFFLFCSLVVYAQNKYDYTWKIGYGFDGMKLYNGSILDFNDDTLKIKSDSIRVLNYFANASLSDKNGSLICYSGGFWIEDVNSNIINNSSNIVCLKDSILINSLMKDGGFGGIQSIMMLPRPNNEDKKFSFFSFESFDRTTGFVNDFIYSNLEYDEKYNVKLIDKCIRSTNNKRFYSAFLSACRHGNGRDWWVFAVEAKYKKAHLFLFTKDGIVQDNEIELNVPVVDTISDGVTCFTNDGKKLALYSIYNGLWVYDFDRCNGTISNLQTIPIKGEPIDVFHNWGRGVANSPNSRYLYVSKAVYMYQFDLQAKDIASSKILIGEYDGFIDTFSGFPIGFNLLQLAPNNKIYGSTTNGSRFLHVIENPDEKGLQCNFRPHSLLLPTFNSFSLPNYPNFRLGAAKGSICDTINGMPYEKEVVLLFPNPYVSGDNLNLQYNGKAPAEFILYDITGRLVYRKQLQQTSESQYLQLPSFPIGNYVWKVGSTVGKLQIY